MSENIITNNFITFENDEFNTIRVMAINDEPWFIASDVCSYFGVANHRNIIGRLDADEKGVCVVDTLGGKQQTTTVNEAGLYHLLFTLTPANARGVSPEEIERRKGQLSKFKRWVTHEVIPSIRKHGIYATEELTQKMIADPDFAISLLQELKKEREEKKALKSTVAIQTQQIAELQPKADYTDLVLKCQDAVNISVIAKDYGWSAQRMNEYLNQKGIQYKQSGIWLLYQRYASEGYTKTNTTVTTDNNGKEHTHVHTKWTQKGRLFIYHALKKDDILPIIEQAS